MTHEPRMNECFMNPHEQAILENFLEQLVRVRGTRKIPKADAMIRRAVDRQPDAAYLLVQRSLMLGQALEPNRADDDRLGRTGDPDPAEDEFVSDDDDDDGNDADFL